MTIREDALAEMAGKAGAPAKARLQADPEQWYRVLLSLKEGVDRSLTERRATLMEEKSRCLMQGRAGEARFRAIEAEHLRGRRPLVGQKRAIEERLRTVREIRQAHRDQDHAGHLQQRLDEVRNALAAVLVEYAGRSDMDPADLASELAVDLPEHSDTLLWTARTILPKLAQVTP